MHAVALLNLNSHQLCERGTLSCAGISFRFVTHSHPTLGSNDFSHHLVLFRSRQNFLPTLYFCITRPSLSRNSSLHIKATSALCHHPEMVTVVKHSGQPHRFWSQPGFRSWLHPLYSLLTFLQVT